MGFQLTQGGRKWKGINSFKQQICSGTGDPIRTAEGRENLRGELSMVGGQGCGVDLRTSCVEVTVETATISIQCGQKEERMGKSG